jgi:cell division protein FtsI (penicillin-binding protein 3)
MLGRTDRRWRMVALLLVFTVLGSASALRLGYWQVVAADDLSARAARTLPRKTADIPPRATIFDRDGKPLAQTAMLDQLVAHPDLIPEHRKAGVVQELGDVMGLGSGEARTAYQDLIAGDRRYRVLEQRLTQDESLGVRLAIESGRLVGITLNPRQVRLYPQAGGVDGTSLASQLLGFVDADGRGNYGVEQSYDDRLTGVVSGPLDIATVGTLDLGDEPLSPLGLQPVHLTIDAGLQRQLEKELAAAKIANGSPRVSGLVMDPDTGAILAWASMPSYDANDFRNEIAARGLAALRDPIASDAYEPGSVMKALTTAAALDRGVVTPTTIIMDAKKIEFRGHTVRNADYKSMGPLMVKDVVALSRNLAITRVAQKLGKTIDKMSLHLFKMWQRLGIDTPTGIDIAAEAGGIAQDPRERPWAPVDLSNKSFGQGVSVTLAQLAVAFAAMSNGGFLVTPFMVEESEAALPEPERVLSKKVARQMREILEHVTGSVYSYAKGTLIFGHTVGGKTGTAQFWQADKAQISKNIFNYTFIGFVGSDDPEAIIAVRIHETKPKILGQGQLELNVTSFELFRKVAKASIKHLKIRKAKDPDVGFPVPRSTADRLMTPDRYNKHMRQANSQRNRAARKANDDAGDGRKKKSDGRTADAGNGDRVGDVSTNGRSATDDRANQRRPARASR